jgi:hypothetical protein
MRGAAREHLRSAIILRPLALCGLHSNLNFIRTHFITVWCAI